MYVRELLVVPPGLRAAAPRWASIVLMRTLNSDGMRGELVRALRGADADIKQAAKWLCEKVNEGSHEVHEQDASCSRGCGVAARSLPQR